MKTYTKLFEGGEVKFRPEAGNAEVIEPDRLRKYLSVTFRSNEAKPDQSSLNFISRQAADVVQWVIDNQELYMRLGEGRRGDTPRLLWLAERPAAETPEQLKQVRKDVLACVTEPSAGQGKPLQIPQFQTKKQFDQILAGEINPDRVILGLDRERQDAGGSRDSWNRIYNAYKGLIGMLAKQWESSHRYNLDLQQITSAMNNGVAIGIPRFGIVNADTKNPEKVMSMTFATYIAQMAKNYTQEDIKNLSHIVRIPTSRQAKDRRELGYNIKNNGISGDTVVKGQNDDGSDKTLFDRAIGAADDVSGTMDGKDLMNMMRSFFKHLRDRLGNDIIFDTFCIAWNVNSDAMYAKYRYFADNFKGGRFKPAGNREYDKFFSGFTKDKQQNMYDALMHKDGKTGHDMLTEIHDGDRIEKQGISNMFTKSKSSVTGYLVTAIQAIKSDSTLTKGAAAALDIMNSMADD